MLLSWVEECAALLGEGIFENKITTGGLTETQRSWLESGRNRCDTFRSSGRRHILFQYNISCSKYFFSQNLVK